MLHLLLPAAALPSCFSSSRSLHAALASMMPKTELGSFSTAGTGTETPACKLHSVQSIDMSCDFRSLAR